MVTVERYGQGVLRYGDVTVASALKILAELAATEQDGDPVPPLEDAGFYSRQTLVVLKNRGLINPERIDEYIADIRFWVG